MHGADCYYSVEGITKKVGQGKENGWSKDLNLYVVLKVHEMPLNKARWLSWLERRPVTAEVVGSSPIRVACRKHLVLIA